MSAVVVGLTALLGCASAMREPAPRPVAADGASTEQIEADVGEARRLFATRDPEKVKGAADAWERALAAGDESYETLEGLIRARVWLTDHEPDREKRKQLAPSAVHAAQWCRESWPDSPGCAYWLGIALGVQARARKSTAMDALEHIERLWYEALDGDPTIDRAGPERALALLYLRAPGWPRGPGDPDSGLEMARAAVDRDPDYAPNLMALAEALAETGQWSESDATRQKALAAAEAAVVAGDPDAPEWVETLLDSRRLGER
jgi:hypothetical protein